MISMSTHDTTSKIKMNVLVKYVNARYNNN